MLQENYTSPIFVAHCKMLLLKDIQRFKKDLISRECFMLSAWISSGKRSIIISIQPNEDVPVSNLISATYKNTFDFFQDVSISYENSTGKNLSSALKIVSCFVLIASLYIGIKYAISSLNGRVSQSDSSNSKDVGDISEESIDEQLEELFKSSEKTQKLFVINNLKVGVIFNPRREKIEIGLREVSEHVILASLKPVPKAVWEFIENKAPPNQTSRNLYDAWGNGVLFRDLGFV